MPTRGPEIAFLQGQRKILEMIFEGAPIETALDELMELVETQEPGMRAGLLIVSADHTRFEESRGPHLPKHYHDALTNASIKPPYVGACGEAADTGVPIIVPDVAHESRYSSEWRDLSARCALAALRSTPIRGSNNEILGSFATYYEEPGDPNPTHPVLVDIAIRLAAIALQRRRDERAYCRKVQALGDLIEQNPFGVLVVGEDFRIVHANPQARRTFGNGGSLIERNLAEALHAVWPESFASEVLDRFRHTLLTGEPYAGPNAVVHRADNDQIEAYDWRLQRIVFPDERFGVICHFYDLSELHQLQRQSRVIEQQSRTALTASRHADRQKDQFLAIVAHELRNPLAPIRTAVKLLSSPNVESKQLQRAQRIISRQVEHMGLILDDLLDLTRVAKGKLVLCLERVTLTSLVEDAVEVARPLLDGKHHRLVVNLPPEPVILDADPLRLSQVLSNLLTNAGKYTDPNGQIEISVAVREGSVSFSVKDNGIGIPPELLDRLFQIFIQVDGRSSRAQGGLGIGLALVRGLVELHGGSVEVKSEGLGHGSEFLVHLPLTAREATAANVIDAEVPLPVVLSAPAREDEPPTPTPEC